MADQPGERISEFLNFNPRWWVDPVPWVLVNQLDKHIQRELAVIQMELQREVLALQAKSLDRTLAVIAKAGK